MPGGLCGRLIARFDVLEECAGDLLFVSRVPGRKLWGPAGEDVGECVCLQRLDEPCLCLCEECMEGAVSFPCAGAFPEHAALYGFLAVDGLDDVVDRDVVCGAGEAVAAARAGVAVEDAGANEPGVLLGEHGGGGVCRVGDGVPGHECPARGPCHLECCSEAVVGCSGKPQSH